MLKAANTQFRTKIALIETVDCRYGYTEAFKIANQVKPAHVFFNR